MKQQSNNQLRWHVEHDSELLEFLFAMNQDKSKKFVRMALSRGQVFVNDQSISQFNTPLHTGDIVAIRPNTGNKKVKIPGIQILHEDEDVIVIDKAAGLLSISTDKETINTAYHLLSEYVKRANPKHRIFIVHRLDRETSGVMVFAKNKEAQQTLQNNWKQRVTERTYIAVVEGRVKESGTITSWLTEDQTFTMHSSLTENHGKKAVTHYEVIHTNRSQSLLKINLDTGRKNQIRIHMKELGHPIVGDKKYGAKTHPYRRLALHAHVLTFKHPATNKEMHFESAIPPVFLTGFKHINKK